jgi:hypothetical protein
MEGNRWWMGHIQVKQRVRSGRSIHIQAKEGKTYRRRHAYPGKAGREIYGGAHICRLSKKRA